MIGRGIGLVAVIGGQGAVFADDHAVSRGSEQLQAAEEGVHLLKILLLSPQGGALGGVRAAVAPGVVMVHGDHEPAGDGILRHPETAVAGHADIRSVTCDEQETVGIVPARGTDGVHEGLVDLVGEQVALIVRQHVGDGILAVKGRILIKARAELLVGALKDQAVVIGGEMLRDLLPHGGVSRHGQVAGLLRIGAEHAPPAAVPVVIDDDEHAGVQGIVHDLLHPGEIGGGDGIVALVKMGSTSRISTMAVLADWEPAQWADVYKGGHWYKYTAAQAVHCSDGDVEQEPFVVENGVFEDCLILPNSEYVIPDGITAIGSITMTSSGAFEECYGLKSIVLPNSLEAIGHHAFMVCLSLESIEIPIGVTQIGT